MTASLTFGILPLPNFTLTPFSALLDVIRLAADEGDQSRPEKISWTILGTSLDPIRSSCGVEVRPWEVLGDPARFDYLVVCGGLLRRDRRRDEEVEEYLRAAHHAHVGLIGLCTGAFMLAQAGVLEDRHVCVSWFHLEEFAETHPDVRVDATRLYVVDHDILTCAGGTGAADLGAFIIKRHFGDALAQKALNIMVIDNGRSEDFPQPPPSLAARVRDHRVRQAALLMEQGLDAPVSISRLAARFGISRRQFERLFQAETGKSPSAFLAELRLERADWLIRRGDLSFTRIAEMTGFSDSSHLSRSYRAKFGVTPSLSRSIPDGRLQGERRPYPDHGKPLS